MFTLYFKQQRDDSNGHVWVPYHRCNNASELIQMARCLARLDYEIAIADNVRDLQ